MKLATKFNLVILSVMLVGLVAVGAVSWQILRANAEREVVHTAGLMMDAAIAMRGYTIGEISPLLRDRSADVFHPQSVPAYAATQAFNKLREKQPEFLYKEATLNPTNPRDRAVAWEADLVETFRAHEDRKEISGLRETVTGPSLYLARPIRITNEGCLVCHSVPSAAPASLVKLYGDDNGFGWKLGEVVGAQLVSVPTSIPLQHAREVFMVFMSGVTIVFVLIAIVLNVLLRRIVLKPIGAMAAMADEVSRGNRDAAEFTSEGNDEISALGAAFNRMSRSLDKAMRMLES
jgi:protein-histidine pros-kinase